MTCGDAATLTLRYTLGSGRPANQFAALVAATPGGLEAWDHVAFSASASRPMRIAVALRPAGRDNPTRWQRSVYVDPTPRTIIVAFDDMQPVPRDTTGPPPLAAIGALMFIVDTNNTRPGTEGRVEVAGVTWRALHSR